MSVSGLKAVLFDVFGTVVDWHGTMLGEINELSRHKGAAVDADQFVNKWRAAYRQGLANIRDGKAPKISNRMVYHASLNTLLEQYNIENVSEDKKEHLSRIDQRFQPWPDSVAGLQRLKSKFIVGTLSNGTLVALTNMAKNTGLPWDIIFSADLLGTYKPAPETYLGAIKLLELEPNQVMLAAAHNYDLKAAASHGMKTGFVCRPQEHGPHGKNETEAKGPWDAVTNSVEELADALGA